MRWRNPSRPGRWFAEVPGALAEAHRRGWKLVALSNSDRDLIDASIRAIDLRFAGSIVASGIGSYKPTRELPSLEGLADVLDELIP